MGTASPRKHKWRQTDPKRTMTAASELDSSNKKSRSSRALEEGAGSSAQQGRRQGRDLSSLSTALWTQEWHLGSLAEGPTGSGQDCEGLFLHLGPWEREPRWAGNTSPLTNSSTTLRAGANPEREGSHTRSSIACNGNSKKTINLQTHRLSQLMIKLNKLGASFMQIHCFVLGI